MTLTGLSVPSSLATRTYVDPSGATPAASGKLGVLPLTVPDAGKAALALERRVAAVNRVLALAAWKATTARPSAATPSCSLVASVAVLVPTSSAALHRPLEGV
jgi:hypothetical protein